jgi:hypothetical protein
MRLFEAAAAGALIITDDFEFPREWFRDSVLYVDAELPAPMIVGQIVSHVEWASRNPEAANRLAQRSNELFRRHLTLESMLRTIPEFVDRVRDCRRMVVVEGRRNRSRPSNISSASGRVRRRPWLVRLTAWRHRPTRQ